MALGSKNSSVWLNGLHDYRISIYLKCFHRILIKLHNIERWIPSETQHCRRFVVHLANNNRFTLTLFWSIFLSLRISKYFYSTKFVLIQIWSDREQFIQSKITFIHYLFSLIFQYQWTLNGLWDYANPSSYLCRSSLPQMGQKKSNVRSIFRRETDKIHSISFFPIIIYC